MQRRRTAAAALLSPLDLSCLDQWRDDVLRHLAHGSRRTAADPVVRHRHPPYSLWSLPDDFGREFVRGRSATDSAVRAIRQLGSRVWNARLIGAPAGMSMPEDWFESNEHRWPCVTALAVRSP